MDPMSLPTRPEMWEGCYGHLTYLSSGDLNSGPPESDVKASPTRLSPEMLFSTFSRGKENEEALFLQSRNEIYLDCYGLEKVLFQIPANA